LRVLHVGKFYPPEYRGGLESVVVALSDELISRGWEVTAVVAAAGGRGTTETYRGARVVRAYSLGTLLSQPVAPGFAGAVRREAGDILHLHHPNPLGDLAVLAESRPLVVTQHSDIVRQVALKPLYAPLISRIFRKAAAITVGSAAYRDSSPELRGFEAKTHVIPFGIDPAPFAATPRIAERVRQLSESWGGRPVVLAAGRLVAYKGFDLLIEASRDLDAVIVIVGGGPEERRLRAMAGANVRLAGRMSDEELVAHYHAADIFCLPSRTRAEAFGMVLLEAMACGKPLVTTNLPSGVSEINRDGMTGRVVPVGDVVALREALAALLADAALREAMGRRAREVLEREYTAVTMGAAFERLYRAALLQAG
jgi:glycosyltransferase involved in cell wall biosynthesis